MPVLPSALPTLVRPAHSCRSSLLQPSQPLAVRLLWFPPPVSWHPRRFQASPHCPFHPRLSLPSSINPRLPGGRGSPPLLAFALLSLLDAWLKPSRLPRVNPVLSFAKGTLPSQGVAGSDHQPLNSWMVSALSLPRLALAQMAWTRRREGLFPF